MEKLNKKIDTELQEILGKKPNAKKHILVFSGGGVKGIAQIGALQVLEEEGILENIDTVAGSSAGAMIGCLFVIGYTPKQLKDFIILFDVKKVKSFVHSNIFNEYGLDSGENVMRVIKKMFISKNIDQDITFKELYESTGKKLVMTGSCLNDKQIYYFSIDTTPHAKVLEILRITISFPIYFTPVLYEGKMFVDGGCIDNFPIQLFRDELESVIGIHVSSDRDIIKKINNIEDFLLSLIQCLSEGITFNSIKGFEKQTIKINSSQKGLLNMSLGIEEKLELFNEGYKSAKKYFSK